MQSEDIYNLKIKRNELVDEVKRLRAQVSYLQDKVQKNDILQNISDSSATLYSSPLNNPNKRRQYNNFRYYLQKKLESQIDNDNKNNKTKKVHPPNNEVNSPKNTNVRSKLNQKHVKKSENIDDFLNYYEDLDDDEINYILKSGLSGGASGGHSNLLIQLQKQYDTLKSIIDKQKEEINKLYESDSANKVKEMQEEIIVLHNEQLRLQDNRTKLQEEIIASYEAYHDILYEIGIGTKYPKITFCDNSEKVHDSSQVDDKNSAKDKNKDKEIKEIENEEDKNEIVLYLKVDFDDLFSYIVDSNCSVASIVEAEDILKASQLTIESQKRKLERRSETLRKYRKANKKLEEKLNKLNHADDEKSAQTDIDIMEIKRKIDEEKKKRIIYEKKLQQSRIDHQKVMNFLNEKIDKGEVVYISDNEDGNDNDNNDNEEEEEFSSIKSNPVRKLGPLEDVKTISEEGSVRINEPPKLSERKQQKESEKPKMVIEPRPSIQSNSSEKPTKSPRLNKAKKLNQANKTNELPDSSAKPIKEAKPIKKSQSGSGSIKEPESGNKPKDNNIFINNSIKEPEPIKRTNESNSSNINSIKEPEPIKKSNENDDYNRNSIKEPEPIKKTNENDSFIHSTSIDPAPTNKSLEAPPLPAESDELSESPKQAGKVEDSNAHRDALEEEESGKSPDFISDDFVTATTSNAKGSSDSSARSIDEVSKSDSRADKHKPGDIENESNRSSEPGSNPRSDEAIENRQKSDNDERVDQNQFKPDDDTKIDRKTVETEANQNDNAVGPFNSDDKEQTKPGNAPSSGKGSQTITGKVKESISISMSGFEINSTAFEDNDETSERENEEETKESNTNIISQPNATGPTGLISKQKVEFGKVLDVNEIEGIKIEVEIDGGGEPINNDAVAKSKDSLGGENQEKQEINDDRNDENIEASLEIHFSSENEAQNNSSKDKKPSNQHFDHANESNIKIKSDDGINKKDELKEKTKENHSGFGLEEEIKDNKANINDDEKTKSKDENVTATSNNNKLFESDFDTSETKENNFDPNEVQTKTDNNQFEPDFEEELNSTEGNDKSKQINSNDGKIDTNRNEKLFESDFDTTETKENNFDPNEVQTKTDNNQFEPDFEEELNSTEGNDKSKQINSNVGKIDTNTNGKLFESDFDNEEENNLDHSSTSHKNESEDLNKQEDKFESDFENSEQPKENKSKNATPSTSENSIELQKSSSSDRITAINPIQDEPDQQKQSNLENEESNEPTKQIIESENQSHKNEFELESQSDKEIESNELTVIKLSGDDEDGSELQQQKEEEENNNNYDKNDPKEIVLNLDSDELKSVLNKEEEDKNSLNLELSGEEQKDEKKENESEEFSLNISGNDDFNEEEDNNDGTIIIDLKDGAGSEKENKEDDGILTIDIGDEDGSQNKSSDPLSINGIQSDDDGRNQSGEDGESCEGKDKKRMEIDDEDEDIVDVAVDKKAVLNDEEVDIDVVEDKKAILNSEEVEVDEVDEVEDKKAVLNDEEVDVDEVEDKKGILNDEEVDVDEVEDKKAVLNDEEVDVDEDEDDNKSNKSN